ncbi:hypothetical protein QBC35DRAFT_46637 [Podospora australis]|uniref:Uncharacterized protein n=1 Tax=Podospora australis TaxID=1536484 RepID=A0AAN7AG76_9PEZI|nr:hypothetical protein QBC35DRAFT_46637 [Podospora australis]
MGAYISAETCRSHYNVQPNCTIGRSPNNNTVTSLGGSAIGDFEGDPDIAGIGVLGAFLAVTGISLLLSIVSTYRWCYKHIYDPNGKVTKEQKILKKNKLSATAIIEALVVSCSDQQVFTGAAYAITLRYAKACTISAYHYNIVANILLVTCATHLMAVTISANYWEHLSMGVLRMVVTTGVYIFTGILLANQGRDSFRFPTKVPDYTEKHSPLLLPAACFQSGSSEVGKEMQRTLGASSANEFFTGQIHGWTQYLLMLFFFIFAVLVSVSRLIRRGQDHDGKRRQFVSWFKRSCPRLLKWKKLFYIFFGLYLVAGIGISTWAVVYAALYVFKLRSWVHSSGWMKTIDGKIEENDASTFGQLVPVFLISLTIFTFLQVISERTHLRRRFTVRRKKNIEKHNMSGDQTTIHYNSKGGSYSNRNHGYGTKKSEIGIAISEPDLDPPRAMDLEAGGGRRSQSGSRNGSAQSFHRPTQTNPRAHARHPSRSFSAVPTRSFTSPVLPQTPGTPAPRYPSPAPGYESPNPRYHDKKTPSPPIPQNSTSFTYGSAQNVTQVIHPTQTPQPHSSTVQHHQAQYQLPSLDFGQNTNSSGSAQSLPLDASQAQTQQQQQPYEPSPVSLEGGRSFPLTSNPPMQESYTSPQVQHHHQNPSFDSLLIQPLQPQKYWQSGLATGTQQTPARSQTQPQPKPYDGTMPMPGYRSPPLGSNNGAFGGQCSSQPHSHTRGPSNISHVSQLSSQGSSPPVVPKKSRSRELREQQKQQRQPGEGGFSMGGRDVHRTF